MQFPHEQVLRKCLVLLATHPFRADLRLVPVDQVVTLSHRFAATKVSDPGTVLLEQHVHTTRLQRGDHEVAIQGSRQQNTNRSNSLRPLPECGPSCASNTAPVEMIPTSRARGKPTPSA